MALILAVNPGSTQSATLARVARQLHGHELIGADSCAIALKALDQRMPALVLLPSTASKGEAELLQRLAPARVPSLRLPSPTSVDPRALADEIREILGERPASQAPPIAEQRPPSTSLHLILAATAAIDWIRARRASWPPLPATTPAPATIAASAAAPPPELEPVFEYAARTHSPKTPKASKPKTIEWEPPPADTWAPSPPSWESERPSAASRASAAAGETRELIVAWLPRVLALAAVAGLVWVGIGYWPRVVAGVTSAINTKEPAGTAAPLEETAPPGATTPARGGRAASGAAAAAANLPGGSGFLAVFSSVEITVSEGTTAVPLDDRSQAMLPAGRHRLRFQNRSLGYDEVRTVQIKPTETTTVNLTPQTTIAVTSNEPAEVSIDGAVVGGTPLKGHRIALGTHTVIVRAAGGERQISVEATSKPVQLAIDFSKPQ